MTKSIRVLFQLSLAFIMPMGCSTNNKNMASYEFSYEDMFRNAVMDAMVAEEEEICDHLIPIVESNGYLSWLDIGGEKRVLVVTWTHYPDSYPIGGIMTTWWGDTWVTAVPELKNWAEKTNVPEGHMETRLKQLLGLPMHEQNTHFVEMWIRPDALLRPSPDNEITDTVASLNFPENAEEWYIEWYNENRMGSYFPIRYPWTRSGYTYDWGSKGDVKIKSD